MNKEYGKKSSKPTAVRGMADGGSVGLLERLRAGNIDQPGSEAYSRWGEGKKSIDDAITSYEGDRDKAVPSVSTSPALSNSKPADSSSAFALANGEQAGMDALEDNDPIKKMMKPAAESAAPAKAKPTKAASKPKLNNLPPVPSGGPNLPPVPSGGAAGGLAQGLQYGRDYLPKKGAAEAGKSGTGTDTRSVTDRLKGFFGLKDGGMVGDGRTYGKKC